MAGKTERLYIRITPEVKARPADCLISSQRGRRQQLAALDVGFERGVNGHLRRGFLRHDKTGEDRPRFRLALLRRRYCLRFVSFFPLFNRACRVLRRSARVRV